MNTLVTWEWLLRDWADHYGIKTMHFHAFKAHWNGHEYRAVCECGKDVGPVDLSKFEVVEGVGRWRRDETDQPLTARGNMLSNS